MAQDEVTQIRVGGSPIGIIGLKTALEGMAQEFEDSPDSEVREALLNRLGKKELHSGKGAREVRKGLPEGIQKISGEAL